MVCLGAMGQPEILNEIPRQAISTNTNTEVAALKSLAQSPGWPTY